MRAEAPVSWPSAPGWQEWWRLTVVELDTITVDPDGVVRVPDEGPVDRGGDHARLIAGPHLQHGASYQLVAPKAPTARGAAGIAGPPGDRVLAMRLERANRRGVAELEVDGLDVLRGLTSRSTFPNLRWDVAFRPERARLLAVDVRLPWLRVRVDAAVAPARDGEGERLIGRVRVTGRGRWRPAIGSLLALVPPSARQEIRQGVVDAAARLSLLDTDPGFATLEAKDEQWLVDGTILAQQRLLTALDRLESRPFWRRWRALLTEELTGLPPAEWPPKPKTMYQSWAEYEHDWAGVVQRQPRRRRRGWLQELPERQRRVHREQRAAVQRMREQAEPGAPAPLTDEMISLDWLASPWSAFRFVRRQERAAHGPGTGVDDATTEAQIRALLRDDR